MTLVIHLFGQPKLLLDSTPIKFNAPPKTLPLLAYLLLHRRQALERQSAAFALWPDDSESAARANLRRHIHQLQNALPPAAPERPWLLGDSRTIGWNPQADFWLDVAEFERLGGHPDHLEAAAACYTGELLEPIYDDWVFFERERLLNQYFDILTRLVFQHRECRNYPKAIVFARQLLNRDAFREDTLRQLITLRYELGDRAGALQEYKTFERRLKDEIGLAPMPETQALHELILCNERLPALGNPQPLASECGPADEDADFPVLLPFVGREIEMERVAAWWSRTARGHGGLSLIGGEAGVGKSRLARQIALLVESQGGRVLIGRTSPEETRPYQAVVEALQSILPLLAAQSGNLMQLAVLSVLVPELKTRCTLPNLPPLDAERERIRLFDAIAGSFEQLAATRPLLLILEDLHWAGESSAALVEFLARRAVCGPILILGTYRGEETPRLHPLRQLRRRLQGDVAVEHTALSYLSPAAVDCLLSSLPLESLPAALEGQTLSARLYAESEGHPLFIELLLKGWRESGLSAFDALPGGIRAVIERQLERLPSMARAFAEAAAVLGSAFDAEAAREIGGWDEAQAHEALRALLDGHLAWETEGRSRFDCFFSHHLIQAALYSQIPVAKRQRRHRRAAEVLEELYPERCSELAGELASHYDLGGAPALAIPHYLTAARQRLAVFADTEALVALDRAIQLAGDCPETPSSAVPRPIVDLLLLREGIYHRCGERERQQTDLNRLEQLTGTLDDAKLACEVRSRYIAYHSVLGERQDEVEKIHQLKLLATCMDDSTWLAQAHAAEGRYHTLVSAYRQARTSLKQALVLHQATGDIAGQVACGCALANIAVEQGHFTEAQKLLIQAESLVKEYANPSVLIQAMRATSGVMFARQDFNHAEGIGRQMLELCRKIGDRGGEADALARLAAIAARLFRVSESRQYYTDAEQIYNTIGKRQGQAAVMVNQSMLLIGRLGLYDEGLALIRRANGIFRILSDLRGQTICAINEGIIALYLEDYAAAYAASCRGLELARQIDSRVMEANALANLGAAERESGKLDEAIAHMEAGLDIRRTLGQPADLGTDLCDLTVAYCRKGDLAAARRAADEMLALYTQAQEAMMHPQYILWAAAQVHHSLAEEQASVLLQQAYTVMQQKAADMLLDDSSTTSSYLCLPFNHQIIAAYERGEWP